MDPLSVTASIISVLQLSTKVLGYLNDVKDAPKDRTQFAAELLNLCSLLFKLRDHVEKGDPTKPWCTAVQALAGKDGLLDQFKQALEILQTKMTDGGRLKKAGEALVWKFKKEEIASLLGRIERLKTIVEIALQMDHLKLSQAIKDDTSFVRTQVPDIQSGVNKIRQERDLAEHRRLLEWISPTDYPSQQSDIIKRRQEGTGQWFLDAPEVARWLSEAKGTLFCPGIPGAGKTMVAAIAIDHLLREVKSSSYGVAYVYCNYKAQEEQDDFSMLAAILKQLIRSRPSAVEPVKRLHQQHAARGTKPSIDEIFSALRDVLAHYPTIHIVIDALDECRDGPRRQFLAKLRDLQAGRDVRLMATSRFMPEIVDTFQEALQLEVKASEEDVKRFVAGQTYQLPKCIQRDPKLQEMVQEKIAEAVDGMFLLARLHTDSLLDKATVREVKSTLDKLSKGSAALEDAYKGALQRIESQLSGHCERAKKVLSWITFAKRPLTTAEICCALAVEPEEAELNPENIPDVEDLVSVCAGLVVVDPESAIIRLVHYTIQEYFERIKNIWNPAAQLDIAATCLTYLSFYVFKSGSCLSDKEFNERLRGNQFLDYAAKHWGEHATTVEGEVCELACSFLFHDGSVSCAVQVMLVPGYRFTNDSQKYPKNTTGLHLAARFGLSTISNIIISSYAQETASTLDKKDSDMQTPLYLATNNGHYKMAKLLLEKGAEVNAQGGYYGNALQAASEGGDEQIVRLLVDKGADVNAQGGYHGNALYAASYRGHEQVVKLLLEKNADVNAQDGKHGNALYAASYRGHEQVVKLLLEKNADVNAQDEKYDNALYAASSRGHEQIVRLLVDNGADVKAEGRYRSNALYAASSGGHEQIVRLLVDNGADVKAEGRYHSNALYAASEGGHEQIVRLLVDKGADVNAQGGWWGDNDALKAASSGGHEQVVKLLLEKNADVNAQSGYYGNALQAASSGGHEQIVRLLIDNGADVNAQCGWYGNALQAASEGGHEAIVRLLVDNGAIAFDQGIKTANFRRRYARGKNN